MKTIIYKVKKYIRALLVFILKILNMPKSFNELSDYDMEQIHAKILIAGVDINRLVGSMRSLRIAKNSEFYVLEYKRQQTIYFSFGDQNNPDFSINIKNDFSCITMGFNEQDSSTITDIVNRYLKMNDFIR